MEFWQAVSSQLCGILNEITRIRQILEPPIHENSNDWITTENGEFKKKKVGNNVVYNKRITFTGTTQTIDLQLDRAIKLNRIETFTNDTTAKSFSIRAFTGFYDNYAELDTIEADKNQSVLFMYGTDDYIFPSINNIKIVITSSTLNKTMDLNIELTEL